MRSWAAVARRIRVPLSFAFALLYIWIAHPTFVSIATGAVLAVVGLVIRALASGHVRKNQELTTSGPYAYTRNPLYLGSVIMSAGFCLAARSWWIAGLMLVIFLAIYVPVIRQEENYLREHFPQFPEYARQVPRFIPRFKAIDRSAVSFSWDLYLQHREYNALLGSVAMMAALATKVFLFSR